MLKRGSRFCQRQAAQYKHAHRRKSITIAGTVDAETSSAHAAREKDREVIAIESIT